MTVATGRTYTVTYEARGWTANAQASGRMHWRDKADLTALWKDAFWKLARHAHVPPMHRVTITVDTRLKGWRLQDPAANSPAVKAAIDGLVCAKVIPDDTGEHLAWVKFLAPVFGCERDELHLIIDEVVG